MYIKFTDYPDGIHDIFLEEESEKIRRDIPLIGKVGLKIKMDKSSSQIILSCMLEASAHLICDRCGEEFNRDLKPEFVLTYLFEHRATKKAIDEIDVYYLSGSQDKIFLDNDVHDYALLSIPMKILCSENCKGLCPRCGANLNYEKCRCEKNTIIK
jgi:uncharacterized protein